MLTRAACRQKRRLGGSAIAALVYLVIFVLLLLLISKVYLIPALKARQAADPEARKIMAAHAALVMATLLFALAMGLLVAFRFSRLFRPRPPEKPTPTKYVDAWEESGRRLKLPPDDDKTPNL